MKRKQNTAHLNKLFETLVCFCEDKNGSVSSVFIESIFDIAAMGYNIQFKK